MDHDDHPTENGQENVYLTETLVVTGNGGPAFFASMQNLMNRLMHGQHQQQPAQPEQHEHPAPPQNGDADMPPADDPPLPDLPLNNDENMPSLEPLSTDGAPSASRPIRPLPRPHAHFHTHTPGGIIDFFTFDVAGQLPPPPPSTTTTFTFNIGPHVFPTVEAFFLAAQKDREADLERAKVLLKGMEIVPEGLVRRLERAGGVPGGEGNEESAGCAVCWGPLRDEVEPGEWDTAQEKEAKAKMAAEGKEQSCQEDNDLHSRIVALPCTHVYHAECLLPWFSRNTTCPTCRFDIDPESLTWTPPPASIFPLENLNEVPPVPHAPPAAQGAPNAQADRQRANTANAARFQAFVNSILRGAPFPHIQLLPPQSQPQTQPQHEHHEHHQHHEHYQHQHQHQQHQHQHQHQHQPQNSAEPPASGSAPPPPSPPNMFALPPQFDPSLPQYASPSHPHIPTNLNIANALPPPVPAEPVTFPDRFRLDDPPGPPGPPPGQGRKKWTPPKGTTLRQQVEKKERELGWRCDDKICGVAPYDEDPTRRALQFESWKDRMSIKAAYDAHGRPCEHSFHPACLGTHARVASVLGDEDVELLVACPACRAIGSLDRVEWDEALRASVEIA